MSKFPKDFLWGAACASFQCEGGWNEDGKGPSIWDEFCHDPTQRHVKNGDTGDVACDSYHRFREDVAMLKQHNMKNYRFSISWPRIMPTGEGEINEKGLAFYDALVDELIANGIQPMITLYHWDLPSALQDKGGWLNREIVPKFARYAQVIAEHFKGRVKYYMTINEPQCIAVLGYGDGIHAPGWKLSEEKVLQVFHVLALSHSAAYRAVKAVDPDTVVGVVTCGRQCFPAVDTPKGRDAAYEATFRLDGRYLFTSNIFLDPLILGKYDDSANEIVRRFAASIPQCEWDAMQKPDFVGFNIYQGDPVEEDGTMTPLWEGFPLTALKWKVTPECLHFAPMNLYRRYGLPVFVTENGLSCNDKVYMDGMVHDADRIDFLHRYLLELSKALEEGVPVMGYLQWSLLDNFEWADGYGERFGLIYVDYPTGNRIPKDSARWYAEVIATNGECL